MKQTKQRYQKDAKVTCSYPGYGVLTITSASWNGFTWMYAFEETNMRCGQEYLKISEVVHTEN